MRRFLHIINRKERKGHKGDCQCSTGILPVLDLHRQDARAACRACLAAAVFLAASLPGLADMPQWYLDKGLSTVDTDGDGIPDVWEKRTYSNPAVADSHLDRDGDGLTDLEEFWHRTDPRTFSTMGDLWSDSEKVAAGLNPLARVEPTVDREQWLAYLGWNAQMWSGWTAQAWLALHAPDAHGFGRPYAGFIYNTLPYSDPSRNQTVDFWLKTRTDRLALATVGDRLSTNTFLVLPGERRYRIRAAKDGPVSLSLDPLPGNFADIPGATNGLWICTMSLEPAQSNLVIFPAGFPPTIPDPPEGLEALVVGEEPEEEPQAAPAPRLRSGAVRGGSEPAEPFLPLALGPRKTDAVHERVSIGGDYGGVWCLSSPSSELPTFASLMVSAPGGVTVNVGSWFGNWLSPKSPPAKFYHHTAVHEMRSQKTTGGHGNQACYTKDGKIIESGVEAGTADFNGPGWGQYNGAHVDNDVNPFVRALQLDGNPCKKIYKGSRLDHPMMYQGTNINSYLHCRPPSKGVLNPVITP